MDKNNYFESLNFDNGKKINISKKIDMSFSDMMHWHPFIEILISLYDNSEVTVNFTKHNLKTNDILVIYPGDLHSLNNVDEDGFILVQFSPDLLMIMSDFNSNFSLFGQYHHITYDSSNVEFDKMLALIKELPSLYTSNDMFNEVHIYSNILKFFVMLGEYCINAKKNGISGDANTDYKSTKLMTDACLYISQNCTEPLTLDDISHHIGISKSHLSHLFKKYMNITFIDFLTEERIKKTEFLLLNPKAHVIDIAFDSGFSSVSSFNRAFKKIKGVSPSEFRRTNIADNTQ